MPVSTNEEFMKEEAWLFPVVCELRVMSVSLLTCWLPPSTNFEHPFLSSSLSLPSSSLLASGPWVPFFGENQLVASKCHPSSYICQNPVHSSRPGSNVISFMKPFWASLKFYSRCLFCVLIALLVANIAWLCLAYWLNIFPCNYMLY